MNGSTHSTQRPKEEVISGHDGMPDEVVKVRGHTRSALRILDQPLPYDTIMQNYPLYTQVSVAATVRVEWRVDMDDSRLLVSSPITIELTSDPTVNYAVQQNDVRIVKRVRVTNTGADDLTDLRVVITTEPAFAHRWEGSVARLDAGATRDLSDIDLSLSHGFLAQLQEAVRGSVCASVFQGEQLLAECRVLIDVLAYDQWNGTRAIPEILAAFVMPNHPDVEQTLRQAASLLQQWTGDPSLDGYQRRDPQRVRLQVAAIYGAIQARQIGYCGLPASFEKEGQKIRTPDRIYQSGLGNCLDLSTLMAACFEQAGLHPLICLVDGHAFPAVWLVEESFADSLIDDAVVIRKRVDLGEICPLEATAAVKGSNLTFDQAVTTARPHLDDPGRFLYALDVRRARAGGIRPLPVRRADGSISTEPTMADTATPPVPAPPHPWPQSAPLSAEPPITPASRLERWKRKLLDLSLRNRLLNFKETRTTVPLLYPDLPALENALAEGEQLHLYPRPQDWVRTARDQDVHRRRTGRDGERTLLAAELGQRRLRCDLEGAELTRRLTETYRAARSDLEENGANTLYLALGMLVWYESNSSDQARRAPILLIPVELVRHSAQSGFTIRRRDEDAMVNVTLLEFLRHEFGLIINGLEPLPEDEAGIDVDLVLSRVRQAVKHVDRWDVAEAAYIGLFSFTKFLMWRDLEAKSDDLQQNKLVSCLINFPTQPHPAVGELPNPSRLDVDYSPSETYCVVGADSSQLAAIYAAGEGKSFVLHGPPGTGKSQTITNIIAQALAQGKTVLFVAEKMAALSVVHRRLEQVGLGPFCLELHSNKSRKADVLAHLGETLKLGGLQRPAAWHAEANRLAEMRTELNEYVRALHEVRSMGESFFDALSHLVVLGSGPRVQLDPQWLAGISQEDVGRLRDRLRQLTAAGRAVGHPARSPWRGVRVSEWTPGLTDQAGQLIAKLQEQLSACVEGIQQVAPILGLDDRSWSQTELTALKKLAELLLERSTYAPGLVTADDWIETESALADWIAHGLERDRLRDQLYTRYADTILSLDLDQMAAEWRTAQTTWFLPRWLIQRRVIGQLRGVTREGHLPQRHEVDQTLELARRLRQENEYLEAIGDRARHLLGRVWHNGAPDWNDLAALSRWAGELRQQAAALAGTQLHEARTLRERWAALMVERSEQLRERGGLGEYLRRVVSQIQAVEETRRDLVALLQLAEEICWGGPYEADYLPRITRVLTLWQEQLGQLRQWCAWMKDREEAISLGLAPVVQAYEDGRLDHDQVIPAFERSFYAGWVDLIMAEEEPLRRFSRQRLEERIALFQAIDDEFTQLTQQEIRARLAARIPRVDGEPNQNSELGILRRELQKRKRHMALRALFQNIPNLLTRLTPCLLMSPISVAQYLDPSFPKFDLVIFDEASQVATWDAVGAIARGKETIIVGDPKQLPPTSFFARTDDAIEDETAVEDLESILDDALAVGMGELHLRWHYRSRHESLIAFSNHQYYQNGLLTFPSPRSHSAVSLHYVSGEYDRSKTRTNRIEAEAVVAEAIRRLTDPETQRQSLGIVTFSMAQQRLIEDLLDEARRQHPEIEPFFEASQQEPVFVKNLENVQGDERDTILFSVCYGPDAEGKVSMNFGPLNRSGGERRLNVAITRARAEVVIFTSLHPEQIDLSRTRALGVQHLRRFMEYAAQGVQALAEREETVSTAGTARFAAEVAAALTKRGYQVRQQVGDSGCKLDLAVVNPLKPEEFLLGVLCDGSAFRTAATARDRHKLREEVLQKLGWRLHRIWILDWWQDPEGELKRLEGAIAEAQVASAEVRQDTSVQAAVVQTRVELPAPAPAPATSQRPQIPRYEPSSARPDPEAVKWDYFSPQATPHITKLIAEVVEDEGPIAFTLLCQRVAPWWGIQRVTKRVEQRIAALLKKAGVKTVRHGDLTFVWPRHLDPATYREFRLPAAGQRRNADELPPEEVAGAALFVLQSQISLPEEALVREVARLLGYQRTGQQLERRLRRGIALLLQSGQAQAQQDQIVVI